MASLLSHLQPAVCLNQRDEFSYFHLSKLSHFRPKCVTAPRISGIRGTHDVCAAGTHYLYLGEWPRLPFTARIERALSECARSASKKGTWPLSPHLLHIQQDFLYLLPIHLCGEGGSVIHTCARPTRAFSGRALREHRDSRSSLTPSSSRQITSSTDSSSVA